MNVYFKTITIRLEIGWQIHSRCTLLKWKVKQENKLVCTCYFFLHFSKQSNEQFETAFRIGSEIQYRHWTFRCESSYFFFLRRKRFVPFPSVSATISNFIWLRFDSKPKSNYQPKPSLSNWVSWLLWLATMRFGEKFAINIQQRAWWTSTIYASYMKVEQSPMRFSQMQKESCIWRS